MSLCEVMMEQEVVWCRMKQLSSNGNSKGHCCLGILYITPNHRQIRLMKGNQRVSKETGLYIYIHIYITFNRCR